jgi:hypothetical protein
LIGFEFEMNYTAEAAKPPAADNPVPVSHGATVRSKRDNFKVEMDGPRMEVTTDPFEETIQGRTGLEKTMDAIVALAKALETACKKKSSRRGKPRWFEPPGLFGATPAKSIYPLGSLRRPYRQSCWVGAAPQATFGIKLGKVDELINKIRKSRATRFPLTGKFRRAGISGRLGLTSEILFESQSIVAQSRRQEIRKRKTLPSGNKVDRFNFSDNVTNLLILVVSYLRTSVMLDSRDYEVIAKAYPPTVAHSDFSKVFDQLLSDDEKEIFVELYGKAGIRNELFKLANKKLRRSKVKGRRTRFVRGDGSSNLFPPQVGSSFTWDEFIERIITNLPVISATPAASEYGPEKVGPPGAKEMGLVLELRRIGHKFWRASKLKPLALRIYDIIKRLNR